MLSVVLEANIDANVIEEEEKVEVDEKFEDRQRENCTKTLDIVDKVLEGAGVKKEEIDNVVLVGEATRNPEIQGMVEQRFPDKPIAKQGSDEVVAKGAVKVSHDLKTKVKVYVDETDKGK